MKELSFRTRRENLEDASARPVDVLVVGGGITGAGIAWDAASRGMRVLLVERRDFGHATSSRTSKMIHGGLRYLQNLQVSMVKRSLDERRLLSRNAPGLVEWLPIVIPVYGIKDALLMRSGLLAYDALAREPDRRHRRVDAAEMSRRFPSLRADGLRSGLEYWDCVMNDARLTLTVVAAAAREGARVANYAEVSSFTVGAGGKISGAMVRDLVSGVDWSVKARIVVNASGPWGDRVRALDDREAAPRLRPNRGAHLIVSRERLPVEGGLAVFHAPGRLLFVLPWKGRVLLGTTESEFAGDPDDVAAAPDERDFLLQLARCYLPGAGLTPQDVIASYAGVRPLLRAGTSLSRSSREHQILVSPTGLVSVLGGKFTTFRRMAEEVVDRIATPLGFGSCRTKDLSLDGVLPDAPGLNPSREETASSVRYEMAMTLGDLLVRRTPAALVSEGPASVDLERISVDLARELAWTEREREADLARYLLSVARTFYPRGP